MIELLIFAGALVVATWVLALIYREAPEFEEVCVEEGCYRPATHERFCDYTSDGTVITELVCRRHGGWRRTP